MQNISALLSKSKGNLQLLLDEQLHDNNDNNDAYNKVSNDVYPFEYFMNVSNRMKYYKFYEDINLGDIVYGTVTRLYQSTIEICLICTGGNLIRDIYSLKIPAICSSNECPISTNCQSFRRGDLVKCIIIHVERNKNVEISMNVNNSLNTHKQLDLGLYSYEKLPKYHRILRKSENPPKMFSDLFITNPLSSSLEINERLKFFQLKKANFSLLDVVNKIEMKSDETAKNLRNSLLMKESKKFVVRGVEYFKKSRYNEALQCYNHALSINESNVDALVARGALRATLKAFELSITDLEKAVKLEPNHKNAAAYLSKTIMAYSKSLPSTETEKVEQLVKKQCSLKREMNAITENEISNPNYFIVISDEELQNSSTSKSHKYKEHRKKKNKKEKSHHRKKTTSIDITPENSDSLKSSSSGISYRIKHKKSKISSRKSRKSKRKHRSSSSLSDADFNHENKSSDQLNNSSRKRKHSTTSSNHESPNRSKANHSFSLGYDYHNYHKNKNIRKSIDSDNFISPNRNSNRKSLPDFSSEKYIKSKIYENFQSINRNQETRIVTQKEQFESKKDSSENVNLSLNAPSECSNNLSEVDNSKLKAADEQIKNIEDFISFLKNNKKP